MADRLPYRAEHVGSLPRPQALMEARAKFAEGELPLDALREVEARSIRAAVEMQERVGIGAITDGEYKRRGWREYLYDRCAGFADGDYYRDPNGRPDIASLQSSMSQLRELGYVSKDINIKDYVDLSLVEEAAKRLN